MKAMKKTMVKKPMARKGMSVKDEPTDVKGVNKKAGNIGKMIGAGAATVIGAIGAGINRNRKKRAKEAEEIKAKEDSMQKAKVGGMVNSNSKAAVQKVAKGKVGGKSKAPKTAVPKAKYGMTMKAKKK